MGIDGLVTDTRAPEQAPAPAHRSPRREPDCCVLLNKGSGKKRNGEALYALRRSFARHGNRFELRTVRHGRDIGRAAELAAADGFPTVVAAGGDGTISTVASRLAGTGTRLGVIPLGTFNYFARGHGIPLDIPGAVDAIANGTVRPIPVGEVNGQTFLNNASIGLYASILEQREQIYRRYGRSQLAAHWSVLLTLLRLRKPLSLKITVDGEVRRLKSPLAFVALSAYQLEEFGLDGAECIRDGQFALYLAPDRTRLEMLAYATRLALGIAEAGRDFEFMCGREILVETARHRRSVAWDGERVKMPGPFRFRLRHDALDLHVPA